MSAKSWWQAIWRRKLQNPRASSIGLFPQSDEERRCRNLLLLGLSRSSGKDLQGLATPALCNTISYPGSRAWRSEDQLESEEAAELVKEELLFVWGSFLWWPVCDSNRTCSHARLAKAAHGLFAVRSWHRAKPLGGRCCKALCFLHPSTMPRCAGPTPP